MRVDQQSHTGHTATQHQKGESSNKKQNKKNIQKKKCLKPTYSLRRRDEEGGPWRHIHSG
jgi:hypothetical protein